jgi:hypothetical protein
VEWCERKGGEKGKLNQKKVRNRKEKTRTTKRKEEIIFKIN